MPRHISFSLTTRQFLSREKTVTRRLGLIQVENVRREPLSAITQADVVLEGFPGMAPGEFVDFFCRHNRCKPDTCVARIEYSYL